MCRNSQPVAEALSERQFGVQSGESTRGERTLAGPEVNLCSLMLLWTILAVRVQEEGQMPKRGYRGMHGLPRVAGSD